MTRMTRTARRTLLALFALLLAPAIAPADDFTAADEEIFKQALLGEAAAEAADEPPVVEAAGDEATDRPYVTVSTAWNQTAARPGDAVTLAITFDIAPGHHIKPSVKKDDPTSTQVDFAGASPDVIHASTALAPPTTKVDFLNFETNVMERVDAHVGKSTFYIEMAVDEDAEPGAVEVKVDIQYAACNDTVCFIPQNKTLTVTLPVVERGAAVSATNEDQFKGLADAGLLDLPFFGYDFAIDPKNLLILLPIAAIGGLLLNFTPCVLPMIPIKIMGLSRAASNHSRALLLGLIMCAGVIAFWLVIGLAIAFISGFNAISTLFQYPAFTVGVGAIIAIMAIGMMGVFTVQLPRAVYAINPTQETPLGSFLFGIMTAVLSTPCTAPFMGAAAAWATTQTPAITLLTFAAIGLGMALPYAVLAMFPQLVDRMPKAGPASELIKQVMGLLLLAAAAFFLGTGLAALLNAPPDPPTRLYWWAIALLIAGAGAWLAFRTIRITPRPTSRAIFGGLGVLLIAVGLYTGYLLTRPSPVDWIYYTPDRLAEALQGRKVVVLDFTAEWCLNCKALEAAVLESERVYQRLNRDDIAPIKVDITTYDEAQRKLDEVGSKTIPLLIVYNPAGEEVFRSDAYSADQVLDAITRATEGHAASQ